MSDEQKLAADELGDLMELDSGLSSWELEFVESVRLWRLDHDFTPKQITKIHQIWDKLCGEKK